MDPFSNQFAQGQQNQQNQYNQQRQMNNNNLDPFGQLQQQRQPQQANNNINPFQQGGGFGQQAQGFGQPQPQQQQNNNFGFPPQQQQQQQQNNSQPANNDVFASFLAQAAQPQQTQSVPQQKQLKPSHAQTNSISFPAQTQPQQRRSQHIPANSIDFRELAHTRNPSLANAFDPLALATPQQQQQQPSHSQNNSISFDPFAPAPTQTQPAPQQNVNPFQQQAAPSQQQANNSFDPFATTDPFSQGQTQPQPPPPKQQQNNTFDPFGNSSANDQKAFDPFAISNEDDPFAQQASKDLHRRSSSKANASQQVAQVNNANEEKKRVIKVAGTWTYDKFKNKTKMGFVKFLMAWKFTWKGQVHEVELHHSQISGKRRILVNRKERLNSKKFFDNGSRYGFTVGKDVGKPVACVVFIKEDDKHLFTYGMEIDGQLFDDARERWLNDPDL